MITPENTQFVIIDIQGKLAEIVHESSILIKNARSMIQACHLLKIPIVLVEQNPKGLGSTHPLLAELLIEETAIPKMSFSAFGEEAFRKNIEENQRKNILIAGIETHICVYQTAADLIENEYNVHLITDAVSSRTAENKKLGIEMIQNNGAKLTCTETAIFELTKTSENPHFKSMLALIK